MSQPVVLQDSFDRGMMRDVSRSDLPENAVYDVMNLLPGLGAPLRRRGAFDYASADINATTLTSAITGGIYADYDAGAKNLAVNNAGRLVQIVSPSSTTDIGAAVVPDQNPFMHRETVIIPANDGTTAPKKYDTTLANLGGSPPTAVYGDVFKDFSVLARSAANLTRVWFSAAGNPASWTTGSRYVDSSYPVTGIKSYRGGILVFSSGRTERLRGNTPPPGGDMVLEPLFDVGCADARSIATWGEHILFANRDGIYITNGSAMDDITRDCGMKAYWQEAVDNSESIAATVFGNYYLVYDDVSLHAIDIAKRSWFKLSLPDVGGSGAFWKRFSGTEEAYLSGNLTARVYSFASVLDPDNTDYADADGSIIRFWIKSPYYMGTPTLKVWKNAYVQYDMRNTAGGVDGDLQVNYSTTVELGTDESQSYDTAANFALTTAIDRQNAFLGQTSPGLAVYLFAPEGALSTDRITDFRLYSLGADVYGLESSRR